MSPAEIVSTVVLVTSAGTVFHVIVIVPVAFDGPTRFPNPLSGEFNVPLIEPLMLVMLASLVVQPDSEPLMVITSGEPPAPVMFGLKPIVPLSRVSQATVSCDASTGGAPA